jgi:DnaK suppressor protein
LRRVKVVHECAPDHSHMSSHLTAGQRAQLKERLELRQHELDRRLAGVLGSGGTRAAQARELLQQDGDDAPQRAADREIALARGDAEMRELGAVSQALRRLPLPEFGLCADCGGTIAFDRLQAEPWALRCVACEAAREGVVKPPRL